MLWKCFNTSRQFAVISSFKLQTLSAESWIMAEIHLREGILMEEQLNKMGRGRKKCFQALKRSALPPSVSTWKTDPVCLSMVFGASHYTKAIIYEFPLLICKLGLQYPLLILHEDYQSKSCRCWVWWAPAQQTELHCIIERTIRP